MSKIYISYSRKDEQWKDRLLKHLSTLEMGSDISIWHDGKIEVGSEWLPLLQKELNEARIVIMLISTSFLASEFIQNIEVPKALERSHNAGVRIIPVLITACFWEEVKWIAGIQLFPQNSRPLDTYLPNEVDQLLSDLTRKISKLLQIAPVPTTEGKDVSDKKPKADTSSEDEKNILFFKEVQTPGVPDIQDKEHKPVIGVRELAEELSNLLSQQKGDKAMMLGIFGQWGRGKTFLMEQIWKALGETFNFERIDFHAWKYQDTPASWAYLYEAFTDKYFKLPKREDNKYIRRYIWANIVNFFRTIYLNIKRHGWFLLASFVISLGLLFIPWA